MTILHSFARSFTLAAVVAVLAGRAGAAPEQSSAGGRPVFDAASVKPNRSSAGPTGTLFLRGGHVALTSHTLRLLMANAFSLDLNQASGLIVGMPEWGDSERFDIQAEAPGNPTVEQKTLMLQSLLADRFKLMIHHETRQLPVLALVLAKPGRLGPQLRAHADHASCDTAPPPAAHVDRAAAARSPAEMAALALMDVPCGRVGGGILQDRPDQAWAGGRRVTMKTIAESLGAQTPLERPVVIDRTGLGGTFDFTVVWNPRSQGSGLNPIDASGFAFVQALRAQDGLKLDPQTGPVDVIVIDHVERPASD